MLAEPDPLLGRRFNDRYLLESVLGYGGFGTVYRAKDLLVDRTVAVKVMNAEKLGARGGQAFVKRFSREARLLGQVKDPAIVQLHDFGRAADGLIFMVQEFVEGVTLDDLLRDQDRLTPEQVVHIVSQVLHALVEAHERGIVHRDIKPENIMITTVRSDELAVKLLDFGIAASVEADDGQSRLTTPGAIIGTAKYMSPEQANGGEVGFSSDLYSVGVMLYELLAGQPPFVGSRAVEILIKHVSRAPPPLLDVPADLAHVTFRALEKEPGRRFESADEMRRALETADINEIVPIVNATAPVLRFERPPSHLPSTQPAKTASMVGTVNWAPPTTQVDSADQLAGPVVVADHEPVHDDQAPSIQPPAPHRGPQPPADEASENSEELALAKPQMPPSVIGGVDPSGEGRGDEAGTIESEELDLPDFGPTGHEADGVTADTKKRRPLMVLLIVLVGGLGVWAVASTLGPPAHTEEDMGAPPPDAETVKPGGGIDAAHRDASDEGAEQGPADGAVERDASRPDATRQPKPKTRTPAGRKPSTRRRAKAKKSGKSPSGRVARTTRNSPKITQPVESDRTRVRPAESEAVDQEPSEAVVEEPIAPEDQKRAQAAQRLATRIEGALKPPCNCNEAKKMITQLKSIDAVEGDKLYKAYRSKCRSLNGICR